MWFLQLLIGVALQIIGFLLAPKPKQEKPPAARDMDNPTADAGRPIPVIFGTDTTKGLNYLWYGEKTLRDYKKKSGGKKK